MDMSPFAQRLSALLDEHGMTRADLARASGIHYHRLNPWFIRASAKPSGPDLLAVARTLGVAESYLINGGPRRPFIPHESFASRIERLDADGRAELEKYADYLLARQQTAPKDQK